jgi:hypothetical protein
VKPALGIIAGSGGLPGKLIDAALADKRDVFVVGVKGEANPALLERVSHDWVDLGSLGSLFRMLKHNRCEQVVFAGPVRRPSLRNLSLDWYTLKLFPRILRAAKKGDGALLSLLVAQIEQEGFQVVGAEQVSKDLLVPEGALGDLAPTSDDLEDIHKGARVIAKLGELDIGQAAVVRGGLVLGVEAAEGTDNLIERCGAIPGDSGGVLVKISKPGQERRVDLPTIGVTTVEKAAAAGLNGIALEADGALILDREQVLTRAEAEGIFIYGISHKILK